MGSVLVLAGAWHVELETLSVEDLVVIEARGGLVESDVLSGEYFIVSCSALRRPLRSRVLEVVLDFVRGTSEFLRAA